LLRLAGGSGAASRDVANNISTKEFEMNNTAELAQKTSIAPMLSVRKGARAVEFYKTAFGARELFRIEAPDGAKPRERR